MLKRPHSLEGLIDILIKLALEGEVPAEGPFSSWLEFLGVVESCQGHLWTWEDWLVSTFPAKNERDLLRQVAFRDPAYRLHLDLLLAQVLERMAKDNRISKIEEFLMGPLASLSSRLAAVLSRKKTMGPEAESWSVLEDHFVGPAEAKVFRGWDKTLFGDVLGGAEQRFPLLLDLYGSHGVTPVHAKAQCLHLTSEETSLLHDLIWAGSDRQGIYLSEEEDHLFDDILQRSCLPVRKWPPGSSQSVRAACIGPVVLVDSPPFSQPLHTRCSIPGELPACLMVNKVIAPLNPPKIANGLWTVFEDGLRSGAYPGFNLYQPGASGSIKFDPYEKADKKNLLVTGLTQHCLFGVLIQFFMVESFGRELGDDCLNILPVGAADQPDRIDVYYRPPRQAESYGYLGELDELLPFIASCLNLYTVPALWQDCRYSIWTQALLVLKQAKVVSFKAGEYLLSDDFFDILHSQSYLRDILRRGQNLRDRIHESLQERFNDTKNKSRLAKS